MNILRKISVLIASLFLILSISTSSFAAGKKILLSIKGPGSGNPFWASVEKVLKKKLKN